MRHQQITGRTLRLAASLALSTVLAACASGPDYVAPQIAAPAAFHHTAAPGTPLALDTWWRGFQDPELTHLIELALAQNLDLRAAGARVDAARATAGIAGAALLPTVGVQASIAAERQSLESPLGAIASQFPGYDRTPVLRNEALAAGWELDLARACGWPSPRRSWTPTANCSSWSSRAVRPAWRLPENRPRPRPVWPS